MLKGNKTQENFKEQIEQIEKQMKDEEKEGKGVFSNIHYKERFYGKDYDEAETKTAKFFKRYKPALSFIVSAGIVIGIFTAFELLDNPFISSYAKAEKYYNEGNYEKALDTYNRLMLMNKKDFNLIYNKGMALIGLERYEEAIETFKKAEKLSDNDELLYDQMGYAYFYSGNYKESINSYKKVLDINPKNAEALAWLAYNNNMLENYDEAIALCDKAIEIDKELAFAYNSKGESYYYQGKYKEAIDLFEQAIGKENDYIYAYLNKLSALCYDNNYLEVIDFGLESSKLFPEESEIPYYIGDAYSALGEGSNAIKYYEEALKLNDQDPALTAALGFEYFYEQDYEKAKIYEKKALELDSTSKEALSLSKAIKAEERPESEKIVDFVKENYLYIDEIPDFDKKAEGFLAKGAVTNEDIKNFIQSIKLKNDIFTFVLHDKQYDEFVKDEYAGHFSSKMIDEKSLYVKIDAFVPKIDAEFRSAIGKLKNTESMNLIIDLRDNGGGLSTPANNILDMLLPERTTSYFIDRKGRVADFYSGESHRKFNKIIVLVNERSASSSELLTLGLKKHLNNVTIVGKPTFGKGVGQVSYESKADKYSIFLVSFYWNVKEQNIAGDKIYPDKGVNGIEFEDYLKVIYQLVN